MPEIQSDVPMPPRQTGKWYSILNRMKPGQSFLVSTHGTRMAVINAADNYGFRVVSRKVNGEGFRIWRLADAPKI